MGREIKRVSLDFDWPLNKIWQGFINPYWDYAQPCRDCDESGYSPEAKWWADAWYGQTAGYEPKLTGSRPLAPNDEAVRLFARRNVETSPERFGPASDLAVAREAQRLVNLWNKRWSYHLDQADVQALVDDYRLVDFTHTFTPGQGWQPKQPPYIPTAAEVNRWNILTMGHDSINQWVCVKARIWRLGYKLDCRTCRGEGDLWPSPEVKADYEAWQPQEPPAGEGWQVWETVSEGSPISPVFASAEELENWLIKQGYSEGAVEQFTKEGWVPSAVARGSDFRRDIESLNMD